MVQRLDRLKLIEQKNSGTEKAEVEFNEQLRTRSYIKNNLTPVDAYFLDAIEMDTMDSYISQSPAHLHDKLYGQMMYLFPKSSSLELICQTRLKQLCLRAPAQEDQPFWIFLASARDILRCLIKSPRCPT